MVSPGLGLRLVYDQTGPKPRSGMEMSEPKDWEVSERATAPMEEIKALVPLQSRRGMDRSYASTSPMDPRENNQSG